MKQKKRNLSWNDKSRKIKYEGKPYFIGFVPNEKLESLTEQEYSKLNRYRRNYYEYYKGLEEIEKMKEEILKIKSKLPQWKDRMIEGYSVIGYLSKDYEFWCSVNLRKRKSKTRINYEKGIKSGRKTHNSSDVWGNESKDGGFRNNPSLEYEKFNKNIGKSELKEESTGNVYEKYYIRIEPKSKEWIRNLYVGSKEDVLNLLTKWESKIDWKVKDEKYIRNQLREIYKGYVRFQIYKDGQPYFHKGSEHPSHKVLEWINEMGDEIFNWMDK